MCPPTPVVVSPNKDEIKASQTGNSGNKKSLQRMNSFHVGPVKLPHPVRMPNGRARNNSDRAGSEDYTKSTPNRPCKQRDIRSYSLKYGTTLDDFTILERTVPMMTGSMSSQVQHSEKQSNRVKTVPLYRPKRSSDSRMSSGSCHIAIEEMAVNSNSGT